jgi:deoxyribonuclease-1
MVFSQAITVSSSQLNFGDAYENAPDSLYLTITNTLNRTVSVNGIRFYDTYGVPAFSASEQNFFIAPLGTHSVWIKFSPRHNIAHNSEMVIVNDGLRGYVSVDLIGQGKYSNTYYDLSENTSEEALKTALHNLTGAGYVSLGYNLARDSMFMRIDNKKINGQGAAQNTIECIYTGREAIGYVDRSDCQTNFSFNTEHTFPQSYFASAEPMKSDLHHLFPTDDVANNYRADNAFGIVTGGTVWTDGGSKATNSLFEPRDAQKGIAARAMMYFVLRYQNYSNFFTSQENILRTWNHDFPADSLEEKRNDDIDHVQHNRNPFVDYPQFIERITSISSVSAASAVKSIDLPQDTMVYGYVSTGVPSLFHFVIVNKGNTDIHLSNFNLSLPEFTFQSGGSNATLAAGEALGIDIAVTTLNSNALHAFLTFNTDDPLHQSVSIPIYANDSVFNTVEEAGGEVISVSPNPAVEELNIRSQKLNISSVEVFDETGRMVLEGQPGFSSGMTINISGLQSGIYIIRMTAGEKNIFRKFVKD